MIQLSNEYKKVCENDLNDGVLEVKKNKPLKITSKDKNTIFRFVENGTICIHHENIEDEQIPFKEILDISISLTGENIAILGHECYSREFVKAVDFSYIFFAPNYDISKCCCYIYDLKHSLGGKTKDVVHFYHQCISSAKYALTICYSAYHDVNIDELNSIRVHFGLITENFEEQSLKNQIEDLKNIPTDPENSLEIKMQAQNRQDIINLPILESILNKRIEFNGNWINLDVLYMSHETQTMMLKFKDGNMI